jgi:nucleotide-binding universal stress UspA family protein
VVTVLIPEIKTILIPVDGSVHARKAALVGAAMAAKFGARVVLLHVLLHNISLAKLYELAGTQKIPSDVLERFKSITPAVYDFGLSIPAGVINPVAPADLLVEIGRRILETEKDVIEGQGVKNVVPVIEDGDPANKILEIAKKEKADFVVMGRRGLGAVEGMLSGSVSTKVSHLAPATVVSVT